MDNYSLMNMTEEFLTAAGFKRPTLFTWYVRPNTFPHILEETHELLEAFQAHNPHELLDAFIDLQYVLNSAIIETGLAPVFHAAYEAVHEANMAKVFPDGTMHLNDQKKVIKPPGWKPADLASFLNEVLEV